MKTIVFPKLAQHQQDVFNVVKNSYKQGQIITVKARRQVGKSILAAVCLIYYATQFPGCVSHIVEPTNAGNRRIYRDMKKWLEPAGIVKKFNDGLLEMFFNNGSEIHFLSQQSRDGLRGNTTTGLLVLDEAAFLDPCMEIVLPYVDANRASILMISTPMFLDSQFAKFFLNPDNIISFSFDWADPKYDMSMFIDPDKLEYYRSTMTALKFKTEMLGQFAEDGAFVFTNVLKVTRRNSEDVEKPPVVIGIDWGSGTGNDYTWLTFMNEDYQVTKVLYFNDIQPLEQIKIISKDINSCNTIKLVLVEKNSIGAVYSDALSNELNKPEIIEEFYTDNDSKKRIVENTATLFQKMEISIPNDEQLNTQLLHYVVQKLKNGNYTYNNMNAKDHDDAVISLCLAVEALNNIVTNIEDDIRF